MEYENREKFTELADHMEANPNEYPGDPFLFRMVISNLRNLEYDDFANQKIAAPKMQMVKDFLALGREDIAQQVINGEFDQ